MIPTEKMPSISHLYSFSQHAYWWNESPFNLKAGDRNLHASSALNKSLENIAFCSSSPGKECSLGKQMIPHPYRAQKNAILWYLHIQDYLTLKYPVWCLKYYTFDIMNKQIIQGYNNSSYSLTTHISIYYITIFTTNISVNVVFCKFYLLLRQRSTKCLI